MLLQAIREIRWHPSRVIAVCLAVAISIGFMISCLVFVSTETNAIADRASASTANSDVVVEVNEADPQLLSKINSAPGVDVAVAEYQSWSRFTSVGGAGELTFASLPTDDRLRWADLTRGSWPEGNDQIAIGQRTAKQYALTIGDRLTIPAPEITSESSAEPVTLQVVGITRQSQSLFAGQSEAAFLPTSFFTEQSFTPTRFVVLGDGVAPAALAQTLNDTLGDGAVALTSQEFGELQVLRMTNGADAFRNMLLAFAAIALLVGSIIITNTLTILVAQRQRQIGLLRAVGASAQQVRQGVLAEALLIGLVGSAVGAGLGIGVGSLAAAVTGSLASGLVIPFTSVLIAAVLGIVVTVFAAILPARRAARVAPMEALQPVSDLATVRRTSRLRLLTAGVFLALGLATVTASLIITSNNVVAAIAGSFLLTAGILLTTPSFLPLLLRVLGRIAGRFGTTGRLAAANTARNPARAAATCTALMLAVGLIVTLQVGAASIKSSMNAGLDQEFPVDVMVNSQGTVPDPVVTQTGEISGLRASVPVRAATLNFSSAKGPTDPEAPTTVRVQGVGPDGAGVVAAGFDTVTDHVALAHEFTLGMLGLADGQKVTLSHGNRSETLTLKQSDIPGSGALVVSATSLLRVAPEATIGSIWGAADDAADPSQITADLNKIIGADQSLEISGSLNRAASLSDLLASLLTAATALLAVAVVIALIGVGNTLGLSVIERSRESALLRALGLQRSQLRVVLAIEALLLAVVGAIVGVGAGVLFGMIGTAAMVREIGRDSVVFTMPMGQAAAVCGLAVVAGALASVLPGRHAARATPTEALADV